MKAYLLTDGYATRIDINDFEHGKAIRDRHNETYSVKSKLLIELYPEK